MQHVSEAERLTALLQLNLLDTPASDSFDRITRMAGQLFQLPIAAVSLTDADRQWFKSRIGVDHQTIPRRLAPCAQVAESRAPLVIPDLQADPDYRDSPLARSGVRFYAGAPLVTAQGCGLGAMCVLGTEPREMTPAELAMLGDLAAMVMSQIELQHALGRIDPVSGLANRTQLLEDLEDRARDRAGMPEWLVLIEVIGPEQVSEAVRVLGPDHVDALMRAAVQSVAAVLPPGGIAYQVGATQLALVTPPDSDIALFRRALTDVGAVAGTEGSRFLTAPSIGVAPFTLGRTAPADALRMAHSAAQDASRAQDRLSFFSRDADARHRRRFTLITDFAAALAAPDQLRLDFQPRVHVASGRCCGAEALLRWDHPLLGAVPPGEFIPAVELTSLVRGTTAWVLERALAQAADWRRAGHDLQISVNVSAANLEEGDFLPRLESALRRHGFPARQLELEVTESAMMADSSRSLALLTDIAGLGVQLAIDDFGTGYSSLAYLQLLPAHVVKIDQSFMRALSFDARKQDLVRTMVSLSQSFGYRVVAEGVESADVLAFLREIACDEAQGYFFGHPMAGPELEPWVAARRLPAAGSA